MSSLPEREPKAGLLWSNLGVCLSHSINFHWTLIVWDVAGVGNGHIPIGHYFLIWGHLRLCLGVISNSMFRDYQDGMCGIEHRSALCKASTLPSALSIFTAPKPLSLRNFSIVGGEKLETEYVTMKNRIQLYGFDFNCWKEGKVRINRRNQEGCQEEVSLKWLSKAWAGFKKNKSRISFPARKSSSNKGTEIEVSRAYMRH